MVLLAVGAFGCGREANGPQSGDRVTLVVPVEPIAEVVRRVGRGRVDVQVLVPDGKDPHTFQPTPRQMAALGRARLWFHVGLPMEERILERISGNLPQGAVVDLTEGIEKRTLSGQEACDQHDHGHGEHPGRISRVEEHRCGVAGADPHVWLSPSLLKILAKNAAAALARIDPEHAGEYEANLTDLSGRLDALDAKIRRRLEPFRGRAFFVFHPSYGYFADAYGLRQEAVQLEDRSPTPKQLFAVIRKARERGVRVVFAQPQFDQHHAESVAEAIGGRVVVVDPLAADVMANLDALADEIAAALSSR